MKESVDTLFLNLWNDYVKHCPSSLQIHQLLTDNNEAIVNDHIAFRTFNTENLGIDRLAYHFEQLGYQAQDEYFFKEKKLYAKYYAHSNADLPKIFISELLVQECSLFLQEKVAEMTSSIDNNMTLISDFLFSGTHWKKSFVIYQELLKESEYAAWLFAFGFRVNHFTVNVNALQSIHTLIEMNDLLKKNDFILNSVGGEIKGSPSVYLEQSSTLADKVKVNFDGDIELIPACFYEFALRYPLENGQLYQGFVEASADKIFESTNN